MNDVTVTLEEGQRQLVLKALATLAVACPGWDEALNEIASKMDNVEGERAQMYDQFRNLTIVGLGDHVDAIHNLQAIMRGGLW